MIDLRYPGAVGALVFVAGFWIFYHVGITIRARARTTKLHGPRAKSWLFGVSKEVFEGDSGALYESWAQTYGPVFQVPGPLGDRRTILMDPKAIAHYFANANTYFKLSFTRKSAKVSFGLKAMIIKGMEGKRQRRILNPAFHNASIRELISIFYDSGYKVKAAWDSTLSESVNGEAIINVQKWMDCVSLDTIGIAAFGHDFGALSGEHGIVEEAFASLNSAPPRGLSAVLFLLGPLFPILHKVPTKRQLTLKKLNQSMQKIAEDLFRKTKKDSLTGTFSASSRSIIGTLIRAESSNEKSSLTEEEVLAQMKTFMLAGYETTAVSLTWALIELALHPEKQASLRRELLDFASGEDASYDQLMNELPYLDAVLRETLRVHPPLEHNNRVAVNEDVIQLQEPISTASGEVVDRIAIGVGSSLIVPIRAVNRSEALWGPDAKEFKPERWLGNEVGLTSKSKEIPGYHHVLSFIDGPRICLGKLFAVAEFKAVLSVLIRNFVFEMRDGAETNIETLTTILPRPYIVGEIGPTMPMRVRRVQSE